MKLYWFSNEDGDYWQVVAARDDERAWECFVSDKGRDSDSEFTVEKAKAEYSISAVTEVTEEEGPVATIFPHEVNFSIKASFGSEDLGHRENI